MSTLKKVLALTLALAMVLSLNVFAAFKDQDKIDADCVDAVQLMNDLGIMTGDNGYAKPLATITRAEAAAMIFRLMTGKTDASMYNGGKYFKDVVTNSWYDGYVNYCFTMGIIQGKTPTTFDPEAPVTGYEIAKMLLVCCGYKSDKQSYTGANWAANVQNDAFNAGMLENYGMSMTAPALRQWVAVMFMDALNVNMVKYQLGELTDLTTNPETTLGGKKFGMATKTGVVVAINSKAALTGFTSSKGYTTVATDVAGKTVLSFEKVADNALLGKQVKVLYNEKTMKVYAFNATAKNKVGTSTLDEASFSTTTSKYTIGSLVATLDAKAIMVDNTGAANTLAAIANEAALKTLLKKNSTAPITAIDNDNDGDIDVVMVTLSQYGTYLLNGNGSGTLLGAAFTKTEAADGFTFVNTVVTKDFVKVTPNVFTGMKDIEALTAKNGILNSKVDDVYTIAGTGYEASDDAVAALAAYLTGVAIKQDVTFYTDGKFIVSADNTSSAVTSMPTNLVLLTARNTPVTDEWGNTVRKVKVLGLDGKVAEYVCANTATEWGNLAEDTIYQYKVDSDNEITLTTVALPSGVNAATSSGTTSLNISNKTINSMLVASDTKLFVKYSTTKYAVMSIADFSKTQDVASYKLFTKSSGLTTVVGGLIVLPGSIQEGTTTVGKYVIATANSYESTDGTYYYTNVPVLYMDGTTATLITAKEKTTVGNGSYVKNKMYEVTAINASGVSTIADCFKGTGVGAVNNDQIVTTAVTGASGKLVQNTQGLLTLADNCSVVVVTYKADGTTVKSVTVGGSVADLFAQKGAAVDGYTYASIKAMALQDVDGGTAVATKSVGLIYVEVVLNAD